MEGKGDDKGKGGCEGKGMIKGGVGKMWKGRGMDRQWWSIVTPC